MGQTKRQSMVEAAIGITIGFIVSWVIQVFLFPLYGIHIDHVQHTEIIAIFTVASIIRSYYVRRLFNWWHTK